jgi:hypothetical protein
MVMICKTSKELHPAYFNCLRTSPMNTAGSWMPKDQGNWWREKHSVHPQMDGTYGFKTEQDLLMFMLKWS